MSDWDYFTTTRSTTSLPTPKCRLPAVVPECNAQWVSYINADDWKPYDEGIERFEGMPDCTQAVITAHWCSSMASFYFTREQMYGIHENWGWVSTNGTSYFPASKSLAPGCTLGCQKCSITGQSVQLYYWPPSTATLVEDGTKAATLTPFAPNGSSLRTVSIDGKLAIAHYGDGFSWLMSYRHHTHVSHYIYLVRRLARCRLLRSHRGNVQEHHIASE